MITFILSLIAWAVILSILDGFCDIMSVCCISLRSLRLAIQYHHGGWASIRNTHFTALRSAAQMVSYEVSIGFVIVTVLLTVGSLNRRN